MSFIKNIFGRRKNNDSSANNTPSKASINSSLSQKSEQQNYWDIGVSGDPNSSDLFEQAKAYDTGCGVEVDKVKAASLYREAMNNGDKKAKHNLAIMYIMQEGGLNDMPVGVQLLQELADESDASAIYSLGGCYMNGTGVGQDIQKGLELYQTASDMGLGVATYSIGAYYINDCHDIVKGIEYCEKAAEQGFALAASILEQMYEEGMGVEKDFDKAMFYLKRASELGDAPCQLKYGMLLRRDDMIEGSEWMIKSANQDNPAALFLVGRDYLNRDSHLFNIPKHFDIGIRMLRKAANLGVKDATDYLAHYGLDYEQSPNERMARFYNTLDNADRDTAQRAFQQMYECSEIGDPIAQCIMGIGYYYGTFVEQDREKGFLLLKKACDSDCVDAINAIGMILNEEKRYEESFHYHKQSAEMGDMYGLHNLGNAYFYARGVERDVKKAFDLWIEAAEKGNPDSHFTLGNIFFRGEYVDQDVNEAIRYYTFAASHPCTTQRMAMEQLVKVYQMIGAPKEADEWNAKLNEIE